MKFGFKEDTSTEYQDYRIQVLWCNISYICCGKNAEDDTICIGIKFCGDAIVESLSFKPRRNNIDDDKNNDDDDDDIDTDVDRNHNRSRRKKKKKKKTKCIPIWKSIPPGTYPTSIQQFLSHPKIKFVLHSTYYEYKKVVQAIKFHAPIYYHQKLFSLAQFEDNNNVSHLITDEEKKLSQSTYRECHTPFLQDHYALSKDINCKIDILLSPVQMRKCWNCKKKFHYLQEHPVCLKKQSSLNTCDNNLIKGIHQSKYDQSFQDNSFAITVKELKDYHTDSTLPGYLLRECGRSQIWVTFALKMYYKCFKYMITKKKSAIRGCQTDADWEHINISIKDWLTMLDGSMLETIIEQRVCEVKQATYQESYGMIIRMFQCMSELFMIKKTIIQDFVCNNNIDRDWSEQIVIHWKNHYPVRPKEKESIILNANQFIAFLAKYYHHFHNFICADQLLSAQETNVIPIFGVESADDIYTDDTILDDLF